ncbi:hypothetical protein M407DRAFT_235689 [Tulasnella calospora MUT 4182]|uniref:F-box domain-containing protein n=1 Tax=Tulasnella calospora MUT 4182 TaxID=1051891 RepID=A0A0C3LXF2_9AGAM|nr:hypothetical protein M407DRAFT_235689 [Tulasnella calospora MUT 4182]
MLAQLPTELKINIIEHVDKRSLPAVLRTNSTFREVAELALYSVVLLSPFDGAWKPAIECFRTMVARPSVAAAVRTLHVLLESGRGYEDDIARVLFETMGEALMKLENLQKLELPGWDDIGRSRSPTIPLPRGSLLPSLRHYYGPAEVIDNIQSGVLATVRITSWRPRAVEVSRALLSASRFSAETLRALDIVRDLRDDDEEWLGTVLRILPLFPNLRFLGLGAWHRVDDRLIDQLIPSLTTLGGLRLFCIAERWVMVSETEGRLIRRLHGGCPQLRAVALGGHEWRFSEELQQWTPPPRCSVSSPRTDEIWARNDYQKYLVDPQTDGFDYQLTDELV